MGTRYFSTVSDPSCARYQDGSVGSGANRAGAAGSPHPGDACGGWADAGACCGRGGDRLEALAAVGRGGGEPDGANVDPGSEGVGDGLLEPGGAKWKKRLVKEGQGVR